MTTRTLHAPLVVSRPPLRRLADRLHDALGPARWAWAALARWRARAREIEALAGLDAHTLKDIGAPDELRAYAAARQAAAYERFDALLR